MSDEQTGTETAPRNVAVAAALTRLDGLDATPLEQHAQIFEDVRSDLRAALDVD